LATPEVAAREGKRLGRFSYNFASVLVAANVGEARMAH
jgi:hypothetical protein